MKRLLLLTLSLTLFMAACQPIQAPEPAVDEDVVEESMAEESAEEATVEDAADELPDVSGYADDDVLPIDERIRLGVLDNGLTYYIRHNEEPDNRAELRLVVNAGSVQEDEDQLGLAHFLEHMLFNGTERFEGLAIDDFLESVGVVSGADLNAYTSFDETVYRFQIPTDDPEIVETGIDILEDWAAYATLDPAEIDTERGVVEDEYRLREESASGRIREQTLEVLLGDSRYANRLPIGDMDIVRTAQRDVFVRFYEDWYRPDLMAVIVVGDIDVDAIESQIIEGFSTLPVYEDAPERVSYDIPDQEGTQYLVVTDPENPTTQIMVSYLQDAQPTVTRADYRDLLLGFIFYDMLNFRLDELARAADPPFQTGFAGRGGVVRTVERAVVGAIVEDDGVAAGLAALMTEVERVRQHGFTASELERAKTTMTNFYEQAYIERANNESENYVDEYRRHYLEGDMISGIEFEYSLVLDLMPEITLADVNALTEELSGDTNHSVIVTAPEKEDVDLPDEEALAAIVAEVMVSTIEPYVDEETVDALVTDLPEPAAIVAESEIPELGITTIELENGVTVMMLPTDYKDDEILFTAVSPGGLSLVSDEDYPDASVIAGVIASSGVGELDETALLKFLAGKTVNVSPSMDDLSEGLSGSASIEDLETMFQLIHLYVTAPRADEDSYEAMRSQLRTELENRSLTPFAALIDAWYESLYQGTIRRGPLPIETVDELDRENGLAIYQDRFADMGDSTFVFVGSFELDTIKALSQQYLGTLPSTGREETWEDLIPQPVEGVVEQTVVKGQEGQSLAVIAFHDDIAATQSNRVLVRTLEGVLNLRISNKVREELGGAYSTSVFSNIRTQGYENYLVGIYFGTAPDLMDGLIDVVFEELESIKNDGPIEDNLTKTIEQTLRSREEMREDNSFWLAIIKYYIEHPDEDILDTLVYDEKVAAITVEDIQQAAQMLLDNEQYIQVVLYPEGE
ncbi:MAG: insulinase family protein [Chloroflexota bacterium]